jgi:hypothetical protein
MDEGQASHSGDPVESVSDAARERTLPAGEFGTAVYANSSTVDGGSAEVIVGEIPDDRDPTRMLWTARCDCPDHDLLGTFEGRALAEECRKQHLLAEHGPQESQLPCSRPEPPE